MRKLNLCVDDQDDVDTMYRKLLEVLGAPDWHGRNLDALWDSISGDDVNSVRSPFVLRLDAVGSLRSDTREFLSKLEVVFQEARSKGVDVRFDFQPTKDPKYDT